MTLQQGFVVRAEPTPQPEPARQQGTSSQWLQWIEEQVAGVVSQIEAEERAQWDWLFATTKELEKARSRIQSMEEEVEKMPFLPLRGAFSWAHDAILRFCIRVILGYMMPFFAMLYLG